MKKSVICRKEALGRWRPDHEMGSHSNRPLFGISNAIYRTVGTLTTRWEGLIKFSGGIKF